MAIDRFRLHAATCVTSVRQILQEAEHDGSASEVLALFESIEKEVREQREIFLVEHPELAREGQS
jgi:hypothetical protein